MIGSISAHLATERALELFAPVQQADYVGWNGGAIGPKGHDDSALAGYEIVDDPLGAKNAVPSADEDGAVCLHTEIEPYDDEPSRGACANCGEILEFASHGLPTVSATTWRKKERSSPPPVSRTRLPPHEAANGPGDVPGPHAMQRRISATFRASRVYACDSPFGT